MKRTEPRPLAPVKVGRRERRSAEIRERLYRTALALFETRGLQGTTVKDITEAADVGKGTFFNYFPTKEHVLGEYYQRQSAKVQDALAAAREGQEPIMRIIEVTGARLVEEARRAPALVRSFLIAILSSEAVCGMVLPHLERNQQLFEEVIAIGQRRGEIQTEQAAAQLARVRQHLAFGSALFWSLRPVVPLEQLLLQNVHLIFAPHTNNPAQTVKRRRLHPIGAAKQTARAGRRF